ncbi:hypothetical protein [Liquorilactobacillus satsumensis]|uniref:hypothetical protein n=1 Tax=Liquorilactobacillus satsumensis TaxID=259059 RepID=UPI001E3EFED3|nr:hypothetical protein [Liquorilactobacillus satsumensis]MCC7666795.1 hypothetical protein [Liquorilactobacillus satsumensis]MCP9328532.1 hypothetical protein [Liquorilactobacillus satsumensis]MCP9358273.1 hypothetical protein [Liquorilactobacillus satsumensis]MCP9372306.1 hypothetical protein [Liquorilactobacillus satsumensis]
MLFLFASISVVVFLAAIIFLYTALSTKTSWKPFVLCVVAVCVIFSGSLLFTNFSQPRKYSGAQLKNIQTVKTVTKKAQKVSAGASSSAAKPAQTAAPRPVPLAFHNAPGQQHKAGEQPCSDGVILKVTLKKK